MATKLSAHEQPVLRVFSSDYVFSIPPYQRPYAWTTDNARELIDDLLGFMRPFIGNIDQAPPYFLGSIVLIKSETSQNADVVDGQQRLTTLTILLAALREFASDKNADDLTAFIYERGSEIRGTKDQFRLSLRKKDRDFFRDHVQREGGFSKLISLTGRLPDSQANLRANAALLYQAVAKLSDQERVKLAQFVATRCFLVVVATPDLDSAYRIFSVLNSRGLDLSATDILKAEITGAIPSIEREDHTSKWEDIEEQLGREQFNELFSHVRMVYRKSKPQGTLLKEFKDHVASIVPPEKFIGVVLKPMSEVFSQLKDCAYESTKLAEPINEHLKWLNQLEFNDWMPPSLAFSVRYRDDPDLMLAFFKDMERLAYWMLISRAGINTRIERFSAVTKAIEASEDLFLSSSSLQLSPSEQDEVYSVLSGPIYESLSARARSTVLLRLDSLVSGGGATYEFPIVTVEHVLPQTPASNSEWVKWFPGIAERTKLVHRLGNLALLTRRKNSSASNYEFSRKKTAYFTKDGVSPFALTTDVIRFDEWLPEVVAERQARLLSILEAHWRLEKRENLLSSLGIDDLTLSID